MVSLPLRYNVRMSGENVGNPVGLVPKIPLIQYLPTQYSTGTNYTTNLTGLYLDITDYLSTVG